MEVVDALEGLRRFLPIYDGGFLDHMNIEGLPPVSTVWACGAILLSLLDKFGFVSEYQMTLSMHSIIEKQQYWRLITTFMYFGTFDLLLLFNLFYYLRFSFMLEMNAYSAKGRAEYIWLLLVSSLSILLLSSVIPMQFLSEPLSFVLLYIWSRRNRHIRVSFFGLVGINAPYLPFVELGITLLRDWSKTLEMVLGIALGHTCSY